MAIWQSLHSFVFVFPLKEVENPMELKIAIDQHLPQKCQRKLLLVTEEKINQDDLREVEGVTYVSTKEINFLGKLKNEKAAQVLSLNTDAFFLCGELPDKLNKLWKKINAHWKIGINNKSEICRINLSTESKKLEQMVNFAEKTLSKIN